MTETHENTINSAALKSYIERIEKLEEDKRAIGEDIKEVFAEAKGSGFDTKIMKIVIANRRTPEQALREQELLVETYERALQADKAAA